MSRQTQMVKVGGKDLKLSNLDKVLYPDAHFTKAQVIDYYARIAPIMLPHLRNRPVTLKRYPDGVAAGSFFEKNCPSHRPSWLATASVSYGDGNKTIRHCVINDQATLIWAANLAALELHTSLATTDNIQQPTMMAFDLDPGPPATLLDCLAVGQRVRKLLDHLGLECFAKTSGGKGLHLYVPLNTTTDYEHVKPFARSLAVALEQETPEQVVSSMSKKLREGKVFIDWSQNSLHKTTVCPYSMRAQPRPTVSAPVTWDEIAAAQKAKNPSRLIVEAEMMLQRVDEVGDLFAPVLKKKQKLPRFEPSSDA